MASDGPGFVTARLDPALVAKVRAAIPVAAQRRDPSPELYITHLRRA